MLNKNCVVLKNKDYEVEFQTTLTHELVVTIRIPGECCMKPTTAIVTEKECEDVDSDSFTDLIQLLTNIQEGNDDT